MLPELPLCSSDTACQQVKGNQQPAAGGAADALDFRVFMQQQAALDAHIKQPKARSSSAFAAASLAQPPTEATVPPSKEGRSGDDSCSAQPGGVDSISTVADATAATVEASGAQRKEVFSRLYEAGQTSLRRKEAYAKASAAAERAALLSAAPHPLPLPAGLPAAGASRPPSPAGVSSAAFVWGGLILFSDAYRGRFAMQLNIAASTLWQADTPGSASSARRPAPSTLRPTCSHAPDQ